MRKKFSISIHIHIFNHSLFTLFFLVDRTTLFPFFIIFLATKALSLSLFVGLSCAAAEFKALAKWLQSDMEAVK